MIESLEDAVQAIKYLDGIENVESCRRSHGEHFTIDSSSSEFLKNAPGLAIETLQEVELSAGFYFLNEAGQISKKALAKLQKYNFNLIQLPDSEYPFNYAIITSKFRILFGM